MKLRVNGQEVKATASGRMVFRMLAVAKAEQEQLTPRHTFEPAANGHQTGTKRQLRHQKD